MKPLRCDERKALGQIEAKLPAEQRAHPSSGAVFSDGAVIQRLAHEIEIGLHRLAVLTPATATSIPIRASSRAAPMRAAAIQIALSAGSPSPAHFPRRW